MTSLAWTGIETTLHTQSWVSSTITRMLAVARMLLVIRYLQYCQGCSIAYNLIIPACPSVPHHSLMPLLLFFICSNAKP